MKISVAVLFLFYWELFYYTITQISFIMIVLRVRTSMISLLT